MDTEVEARCTDTDGYYGMDYQVATARRASRHQAVTSAIKDLLAREGTGAAKWLYHHCQAAVSRSLTSTAVSLREPRQPAHGAPCRFVINTMPQNDDRCQQPACPAARSAGNSAGTAESTGAAGPGHCRSLLQLPPQVTTDRTRTQKRRNYGLAASNREHSTDIISTSRNPFG